MDERFADLPSGIRLCYETFGDPADPTLLLVMGLATQMTGWHEDLCRLLVGRGYHVIRFDNRDCGRSSVLRELPTPAPTELVLRHKLRAAYTLDELAEDAAALLGVLGIDRAHVVGASMGGMIAQLMAIRHVDRVLSLTSIMSTTGARGVGQPAWRIYPILLRQAPKDKAGYVEFVTRTFTVIGSPGFPRDDDELRAMAALSYERGIHPSGTARQLAAILASADRSERLGRVKVPTLVIHGLADQLVRHSGGRATAKAVPGARLLEIPGMGHDLPRGAWPRIVDAITETAAAADAPRAVAGPA